jgi:transcription initiation factor IIE alpha subunit
MSVVKVAPMQEILTAKIQKLTESENANSPRPTVPRSLAESENGILFRCEGCGGLLRYLTRTPDGRDLCKRCANPYPRRKLP